MQTDELHQYGELFYRYQREGSLRSARSTLPHLLSALPVTSVLDVGCGAGAWLAAYLEAGVGDVLGVDGDYVDRKVLLVQESCFLPQDISRSFDLGRQFDLVQCLEVAEHIQPNASESLVDNIVRHGRLVLFSAAVPGQGGEDHINERSLEFWRDRFADRGYRLFDYLRPRILDSHDIESWYRYNMMLFVRDDAITALPESIRVTRIPDFDAISDPSPVAFRIRKALLRSLSIGAVTTLAKWKHRRAVRALAASQR